MIAQIASSWSSRSRDSTRLEVWRIALFRAQHQRALDGVLATAEGFGSVGDADGVIQALSVADTLAAQDAGDAHGRVGVVGRRLLPDST